MATNRSDIFAGTVSPKAVTDYMLMRGVPDYSKLQQYHNFETGYSFLIVLDYPVFLQKLRTANTEYEKLIDNYLHILEYEFKGISGFEDMSGETSEITNGHANMNLITKVNYQSAGTFSMRYWERSGLVIAKAHELFLRSVKDPTTQTKTYSGLLKGDDGLNSSSALMRLDDVGYENEVFQFLYFVTDNTRMRIEKAYLIINAQPTTAPLSEVSNISNENISWVEVECQFNGVQLSNPLVTLKAQEFLNWINKNTIFEQSRFGYQALREMKSVEDHGNATYANKNESYLITTNTTTSGSGTTVTSSTEPYTGSNYNSGV